MVKKLSQLAALRAEHARLNADRLAKQGEMDRLYQEARQLKIRMAEPGLSWQEISQAQVRYKEIERSWPVREGQLNQVILAERKALNEILQLESQRAEALRVMAVINHPGDYAPSDYTDSDFARYRQMAERVLQETMEG